MRQRVLLVTLVLSLLSITGLIHAQNSMPLLYSFEGPWAESWYGRKMAAIDLNADGYDDLLVFSGGSTTNPDDWTYYQLFWGGNAMSHEASLIKTGDFNGQVTIYVMMNAGDLNGDGYDDLMYSERYAYMANDSLAIRIVYGGPNADMTPDYTINTDYAPSPGRPRIDPQWRLGDINGDGYDDLGILHWNNGSYPDLAIMLGGSFQIITVKSSVSDNRIYQINGVGDVNNDGYDDFVVGYALRIDNVITTFRYLFFGGDPIDLDNPVLLRTLADNGAWNFPGAYKVGDFNGDGFDDFVYCNGDSWPEDNKLRYGAEDIMSSDEFTLLNIGTSPSLINMDWHDRVVYGDFNGDGYSDIAGANFKAYIYQGVAGFWLGGANPNTTCDLRIDRPSTSPYQQFGYYMAAGDFNGDGYCDVAISAPHALPAYDPVYKGYVYIFAGNSDLTDTTVSTDDYLQPPATENIKIKCYPNPFHAESPKISYEIEGELPSRIDSAIWTIHNIRGQVVHRQTADQPSKSGSLLPKKLSPGVYVVSLHINGQRISSSKITIR